MKRLILPVLGLVLIAVLIIEARSFDVNAMGNFSMNKEHKPSFTPAASAPQHVAAEGWMVTYPGAKVTLGSDVAGTITNLPFEEKWPVQKGQIVAEIRADDVRASIAQSETVLNQVDADIEIGR